VKFGYKNMTAGTSHMVKTLEETEYPGIYKSTYEEKDAESIEDSVKSDANSEDRAANNPLKSYIPANS